MKRRLCCPPLILTFAAVLALSVAGFGRDPTEAFLRQGNKLVDRGLFADAVVRYTRAVEQNPNDVNAYYYRALANEMVDRQAAISDWRKFVELMGTDSDSREAVTQAQERVEALEKMSAVPDSLLPSRYVPKAGDYYQEVAGDSLGLLWTDFPVKVFAESPPEEWRRALKEALDAWSAVFPLEPTTAREGAGIVISWAKLPKGAVGKERDSRLVETKVDQVVKRRKTSSIILNNSQRWTEHQMLASLLHELGHALGIKGHSAGSRDVMFPEEQDIIEESKGGQNPMELDRRGPSGIVTRTHINTKLTPRDTNTLIRLYNCPGPLVSLR